MSYEEIDSGDASSFNYHGETIYLVPGMEFDETICARCGDRVGPYEGLDPDTKCSCYAWGSCFMGPLGIVCENCADTLNATELVTLMNPPTWVRNAIAQNGPNPYSSRPDRIEWELPLFEVTAHLESRSSRLARYVRANAETIPVTKGATSGSE